MGWGGVGLERMHCQHGPEREGLQILSIRRELQGMFKIFSATGGNSILEVFDEGGAALMGIDYGCPESD